MTTQAQLLTDRPAGVSVWSVPLDVPASRRVELARLLDASEQARAAAFAFQRDADRFVVAHATLRTLLADAVGSAAGELRFDVEPGTTKPRLVSPPGVAFNLSHSADRALVAIVQQSTCGPALGLGLGVDIERIDQQTDVDQVARRFFSDAERAELAAIAERPRRVEAFYACWTRKESVLKGVGTGLELALADFDVSTYATGPFPVEGRGEVGRRVAGWVVHPLRVGSGWAAALALSNRSGSHLS